MNLIRTVVCVLTMLISTGTAQATVAGVEIESSTTLADGTQLILNGAGVRTKFFVDVYVGALYLSSPSNSAQAILDQPGPTRMLMHVLHSEISHEKLAKAWTDGFQRNHTNQELASLEVRLERFSALFPAAKRGDVFSVDFLPTQGTVVSLNGEVRGVIEGADFSRSVLSVWLGQNPVSKALKRRLLGND